MAANSALLKGWTVTMVAATFALAAKDADIRFILIAYFPAIMFWVLDAYYLRQERMFRDVYNTVRQKQESDIDFSMDTSTSLSSFTSAFLAAVNLVFYGILIAIILVVMFTFHKIQPH